MAEHTPTPPENNFTTLSGSGKGSVELKEYRTVQGLAKLAGDLQSKLLTLDSKVEFSDVEYQKFKTRLLQMQRALDRADSTSEKDKPEAVPGSPAVPGPHVAKAGKNGRYAVLIEDDNEDTVDSVSVSASGTQPQSPRPDGMVVARDEHGNEIHTYDLETYFTVPYWKILVQRLPWLVGLLLLQSFSATILGAFDVLLEDHIIVAYFIPMLVGSGGNAGNQPGVMVTRALGSGELKGDRISKLFKKEAVLACITASVMGILGFCRVLMDPNPDPTSAFAIGLSLWFVIFVAIFLGIIFSLVLDRLGVDPASGSAPLLTTIADLIGITLLCLVSSIVFGEI